MKPTRALWETQQDLVAADTANLAAATSMHLHLVAASFLPSLDIVLGSLTFATFTGSAALNAGIGTQAVYYDPLTGLRVIEILEPAGGWHWKCTVTPGAPETIYGVALTDHTDAVLLGTQLLDTPVPISAAGQGLDLPFLRLQFLLTSPF